MGDTSIPSQHKVLTFGHAEQDVLGVLEECPADSSLLSHQFTINNKHDLQVAILPPVKLAKKLFLRWAGQKILGTVKSQVFKASQRIMFSTQ